MANYGVKMGQPEDIISPMMRQHRSNLSRRYIMLFRVHHIVQQHPDHPDHRLTIKMSEKLLDVGFHVFLSHWDVQEFMSYVIYNILQLHKDSLGRFLSHRGDGVQLVLDGLFRNKPTPVDSEERFKSLFGLYLKEVRIDNKNVPVVIDCEIVRYHQFMDLNEAIVWWESTPINAHDMVPATNSSPSIRADYKLRRRFDQIDIMIKVVVRRQKQCAICLEECPPLTEMAFLYCSHFFHVHCITCWFKKSQTCPVCRMILD